MGLTAREILDSIDQLPDEEKLGVVSEIIRRSAKFDFPPLSDEELILNAEALFLELDERETEKENLLGA